MKGLFEVLTFSFAQRFKTKEGYAYYKEVLPKLSHAIYYEPARFGVISALRLYGKSSASVGHQQGSKSADQVPDALVVAVPRHLHVATVDCLTEEFKKEIRVSADDVNVLLAEGYNYWNVLALIYVAIPVLSIGIVGQWLTDTFKVKERLLCGGSDPSHTAIAGSFGSRWARDLRRE